MGRFTIKENLDCVGSPTTVGVPLLANAMPSMDSPVVERMKAAGAGPLARTNLPEMGLRLDTDNPLRGRTRNPWNGALTPGGSSGTRVRPAGGDRGGNRAGHPAPPVLGPCTISGTGRPLRSPVP